MMVMERLDGEVSGSVYSGDKTGRHGVLFETLYDPSFVEGYRRRIVGPSAIGNRLIRSGIRSANGLAQRSGIDRGGHGLHLGENLLSKEAEAFFSLVTRHPAIEHMEYYHLETEGPLRRFDLVDDLVRGADGLDLATDLKGRIGHTDVGGLSLEVLFVAVYALVTRVVPFEVVVLSRSELVLEGLPPLFGFRRGLSAVHP